LYSLTVSSTPFSQQINSDSKTYKDRSERRKRTSSLAQSHQIRDIISKTVEELSARHGNINNSCSESAEDILKKVLAEAKASGFSADRIFSILSSSSISENDGVADDMIQKETFSTGLIKLSKGIHSWKKEDLEVIADKFDINKDGFISFVEFQHYCYHEVPSVAWRAERQRKEALTQAAQNTSIDTAASFNLKDISYAPGHVVSSRSKIFWKINVSVECVLRYCSELGTVSIQIYDMSTKTDFKTLYLNKSSCVIDQAALEEAMTKDDRSAEEIEWEHYSNYIMARLQIVKDENEEAGYIPRLLKLHNDGDISLEIDKPRNMNAPAMKYLIKSGKSLEDEFQQKVRSFEKESRSARSSRMSAEDFIRSARNSRNTADGKDSLQNIMRQALEEVKLELGEN
jgi:hypothetical protein